MSFERFPKMARWSRDIIITEKIDGTNAQVFILDDDSIEAMGDAKPATPPVARVPVDFGRYHLNIWVGSRTRWITPEDDNFNFARFVLEQAFDFSKLGPGRHFGEWWGSGIQRGYGLKVKKFSLFNVKRWRGDIDGVPKLPELFSLVPVLYEGPMVDGYDNPIAATLDNLARFGSRAAPGFADPEGIVIYHTQANVTFKKTIKGDADGKGYGA